MSIHEIDEHLYNLTIDLKKEYKVKFWFEYKCPKEALGFYDSDDHKIYLYPALIGAEFRKLKTIIDDITYENLGTVAIFHEIGHAFDRQRNNLESKFIDALEQNDFEMYANLYFYSEFTAYILGRKKLLEFLKSEIYENLNADFELDINFYDFYNLSYLEHGVKKLLGKFPSLFSSVWFNKVEKIIQKKDLGILKSELQKLVEYNKTDFK